MSGELYAPTILPQDNEPPVPTEKEGGQAPKPAGIWLQKEKSLPLPGIKSQSSSP